MNDLYIKIPINKFVLGTVALPLVALVTCFLIALLFGSNDIYKLDCGALNVLPSISAVIGYSPQCYIWRSCIALHSFNRFVLTFAYNEFYKKKLQHCSISSDHVRSINFYSSILENSALVLITYVSNKDNFKVHELGFILFECSANIYMLTTLLLQYQLRLVAKTKEIESSYNMKKNTFASSVILSILLATFFYIHRIFCIDYMFSLFCVTEYVIVLLNIFFHATAIYDFKGSHVVLGHMEFSNKND